MKIHLRLKTYLACAMAFPLIAITTPNAIAAKDVQPYEINRGDTLSQIAEGLYGNWIKYKDLWQLNQDRIANPDLIYPGQRLRLIGGGELELVAANGVTGVRSRSDAPAYQSGMKIHRAGNGRSNEWQILPQQSWERFTFKASPLIDPFGFDKRSRIGMKFKNAVSLPATLASDRLALLGEITGGRSDYGSFGLGEQVLIRADEELQVGHTYSITQKPQTLYSRRDSRPGFFYRLSGKIRIVGVRDQVFVGTVVQANQPIVRGDLLVQEVSNAQISEPVPAPSALVASIMEDESEFSINLTENRIIYLDLGTDDGVKPGMIFRRYLHTDPNTQKKLSAKDFLIEAEVKVLESSARFSSALVISSRTPIHRTDELVALTDVSDIGRHMGLQGSLQEKNQDNLDELDQMDASQGLGDQEDRELRQLEDVDGDEATTGAADDIQKVEINSNNRQAVELGKENGPNDGSGGAAKAAPPAEAPAETPAETPTETTPDSDDTLDAPLTAPAPAEVAPAAPKGDPFETDTMIKGLEPAVDTPPVTEGTEAPADPLPTDPLMDAFPTGTPKP